MDLNGKVALVTGGARRVGRAIALGLADAGADIVISYNQSAAEAEEVTAALREKDRRALAVQADISRAADIARLVATIQDACGRLDILVNSAARFDSAPILDITEADWDRVMAVNLKGPFLLSQKAAPLLAANGGGVIINIADLSALQAWPSYAHHAVSKAGLVHLTRILARALAPGVRANCVVPGTVLPPDGFVAQNGSDERRVIGRSGQPSDVSDAVLYFARSEFVTGAVLVVDGGRMLL